MGYYDEYGLINFREKRAQANRHIQRVLNMCSGMIELSDLPESIPEWPMKRKLQTCGYVLITRPGYIRGYDGALALLGNLGGENDVNGEPTRATITINGTTDSYEAKIGQDVVLIRHDPCMQGLLPIIQPAASLMAENELSMRIGIVNGRAQKSLKADSDRAYKSAIEYLRNLEEGDIGAIKGSAFFDDVKEIAAAPNVELTGYIEMQQYLLASLYNSLGINGNYNMKRESLSIAESQMTEDGLLPYVDAVLKTIRDGLNEANEKFGLGMKVELGSAWKKRREEGSENAGQMDESERSAEDPGSV